MVNVPNNIKVVESSDSLSAGLKDKETAVCIYFESRVWEIHSRLEEIKRGGGDLDTPEIMGMYIEAGIHASAFLELRRVTKETVELLNK